MSNIRADLLSRIVSLPGLNDVPERKAFVSFTGYAYVGLYLDWSGSQAAFAEALIDEISRRGQRFTAAFLGAVCKAPQVSPEAAAQLDSLARQIEALRPDEWLEDFPVEPFTAQERSTPIADLDMLAAAVSGTLLPYYALSADALETQAGLHGVQVAQTVAARVDKATASSRLTRSVFHKFVLNPAETESDFLAGLRDLLDQDGELARDLAEILTADIEHEDDALQAMVRVAQNIRTVKGSVVGVIVGADTIDRNAHSPRGSIADVHQTVAAVQPGGTVVGAIVSDVVAGDKVVTGDIKATAVAIGEGARVIYQNVERARTDVELLEQEQAFARDQLAEAMTRYVKNLVRKAEPVEDISTEGNPYKALLAYDIDDAALFFGRARAKVAMLEHLRQGRLTVLHAESGAGKTSLLKAGLMPELLARGHVPLWIRTSGTPVHEEIRRQLLSEAEEVPLLAKGTLHNLLRQVTNLLDGQELILLVDQFEEFFREQSQSQQTQFLDELAPCLNDAVLPVRWVFALRAEYLSRLGAMPNDLPDPFANQYLLQNLIREEARQVIEEPARTGGVTFDPAVVGRILNDLDQGGITPAQLQLVCSTLYDSLPAGKTIIDATMYGEGGAERILQEYLSKVLDRDILAEQRMAARMILEELITSDGHRQCRTRCQLAEALMVRGAKELVPPEQRTIARVISQPLTNLVGHWQRHTRSQIIVELTVQGAAPTTVLDAVLPRLVTSRLVLPLPGTEKSDDPAYELTHDYLVGRIQLDPAELARKNTQEMLDRAVRDYWPNDYEPTTRLLLDQDRYDAINVRRDELVMDEQARKLIKESGRRLEGRRRLFRISAVGVAILVVLATLSVFTLIKTQRERAEFETRVKMGDELLKRVFDNSGDVPLAGSPSALTWDGTSMWVADPNNDTVQRVNPKTGEVTGTVAVGDNPSAVVWDGNNLWVANSGENSVNRIDPQTEKVTATVKVGKYPGSLAWDNSSIWVANRGDNTVQKIDPQSGEIMATVSVSQSPHALAWDGATLWVAVYDKGALAQIDPQTEQVLGWLPVGRTAVPRPESLVWDGTSIWVANWGENENTVQRIDPTAKRVVATIEVGEGPNSLTWDGASLWVANERDNTVQQIDPVTNSVIASMEVGPSPVALAWSGDAIWVASRAKRTLQQLRDHGRAAMQAIIRVGKSPHALAWDGNSLWVANRDDDSVQQIDLESMMLVATIPVGSAPSAVAWDGTSLWVANGGDNTIQQIDPYTQVSGSPIKVGGNPTAIASDGATLWVTSRSGRIEHISPQSGKIEASFEVGGFLSALAWDGKHLWVADYDDSVVKQIDPATGTVIATVPVGRHPRALVWVDDSLWVANSDDYTVQRIDTTALAVAATVDVGIGPIALAWDGTSLWVASVASNSVEQIDPVREINLATLHVGNKPAALVWDGTSLWVANFADNTVQQISARSLNLVAKARQLALEKDQQE